MQPDWQLGADKLYDDLHIIVVFVVSQPVSSLMVIAARMKLTLLVLLAR